MWKNLLRVALVSLLSLLVFWSPFLLKLDELWGITFAGQGMNVVVQNFDGLNFLVVSKSLYDPKIIETINAQFLTGNDPIYFAAHFPLFPVLIRLFSYVLPLPYSLIIMIVLSNFFLAWGLYYFFLALTKNSKLTSILTTIALFFPARMLSVRGVGSNEPLFIFLVLLSLVLATKQKYWASAVYGALAVLTRSPGILLFGAYVWAWLAEEKSWKEKILRYLPFLMMPMALLGLFIFYGVRYQDPVAYFHSGDNLHLFFPPFQIFSNTSAWISDMWREDIIYLYFFYGIGIGLIDKKWDVIKKFGLLYGLVLLFVAHRDLSRYALPIAPLAILGYAPLLDKIPKKAWYFLLLLLLPIYLLGWQFILKNIQPINDWGVFL